MILDHWSMIYLKNGAHTLFVMLRNTSTKERSHYEANQEPGRWLLNIKVLILLVRYMCADCNVGIPSPTVEIPT